MIITGGKYRSRKLISPSEKIVKPTLSKVRESVFNILLSRMDFEGKSFLDLFAGSGIMGFEAVSRGFSCLTAIDNNAKNIALLKQNADTLGINGVFIKYDAFNFLKRPEQRYDVIYIDPPYDTDFAQTALDLIYKNNLVCDFGFVIVETKKDKTLDLSGYNLVKECVYGLCKLEVLSIKQK